jgi:hypothetical protein
MEYFSLQETVFDHLMKRHQQDESFTFSVRQKASKGAERNLFIGTEKSSYFGFTCWDIPVYFPGSSIDLTAFKFTLDKEVCHLDFQYYMAKSAQGSQNEGDLAVGRELLTRLQAEGKNVIVSESASGLRYVIVPSESGYTDQNELLEALDSLYAELAPIIDVSIAAVKQGHPNWKAGRYSKQRFDYLLEKMDRRLSKYSGNKIEEEEELPVDPEETDVVETAVHSLNSILYGPPGTGKTYHTIDKAMRISAPHLFTKHRNDREELTRQFRNLLIDDWKNTNSRIAFVTFHQSMSYEDFIEGIKPQKPEQGQQLAYDIESGIFKKMCELSRSNYEGSLTSNKDKLPFEEAFERLEEEWGINPEMKFPLKTEGYEFTITGFTNTSIRFRKSSGSTSHTLSINTLREQYYGKVFDFKQGVGIYYPALLNKLNSYSKSQAIKTELHNYVLVIDEINRGNVSQIFGELITLLEEDKRQGKPEAISVTLPYSKEAFSVPPNLFIIGTMNTADRSVEALDTALRRRFTFEEMMPQPELLSSRQMLLRLLNRSDNRMLEWEDEKYRKQADPLYELLGLDESIDQILEKHLQEEDVWTLEQLQVLEDDEFEGGIDLERLLKTINLRIVHILDKDHQIGHAFFINVSSLIDLYQVFQQKLIPQLKEYFFGDYGKIGLVLGEEFIVQEKNVTKADFAKFTYDELDNMLDRPTYSFQNFEIDGKLDFESFLAAVTNIYV